MNLTDSLLNLTASAEVQPEIAEAQSLHNYAHVDGLCPLCDNRPHCVWVENTKIHCEHYE